MQENVRVCEPTNVGRSNERNDSQQAEFEAMSSWKKKFDEGYREDIEDTNDVPVLPMLAQSFAKRKDKVKYPVFCQPKINGNRGLCKPNGDIISRSGKIYVLPHISEQIKKIGCKYPIDGELYIHGEPLQNIISYVKKDHDDGMTEKVCLVVYDVVAPGNSMARMNIINKLGIENYDPDMEGKVAKLETITCNSEKEVLDYEKDCVKRGYEGCMVRTQDLQYENNHRSNNLLKVKSFQDDEFEVVDFKKAENGKVIWTCKNKQGTKFDCYHKSTLEKGRWYYDHARHYIGSKLTVKYFEILPSGLPQFPVGICFRNEEDLPMEK
jgi:ATP-dependent DNA ligase